MAYVSRPNRSKEHTHRAKTKIKQGLVTTAKPIEQQLLQKHCNNKQDKRNLEKDDGKMHLQTQAKTHELKGSFPANKKRK